mmetsp:Transcript_88304/g.189626  ORF Transcript_88304/g.189626 Transcript_88304/m.189626 type:complete len:208 (+) Transcript_88304:240-863(+)
MDLHKLRQVPPLELLQTAPAVEAHAIALWHELTLGLEEANHLANKAVELGGFLEIAEAHPGAHRDPVLGEGPQSELYLLLRGEGEAATGRAEVEAHRELVAPHAAMAAHTTPKHVVCCAATDCESKAFLFKVNPHSPLVHRLNQGLGFLAAGHSDLEVVQAARNLAHVLLEGKVLHLHEGPTWRHRCNASSGARQLPKCRCQGVARG